MKQAFRIFLMLLAIFATFFIFMTFFCIFTDWEGIRISEAEGADRCQDYVTDIRIQHWKYFGTSYPYWYGVGQARQESACRANVTAFDAGMGLTQFMPRTWREVESDMGMKLDPYNPEHSIRAQAFYMRQLHKQNWDGALWLTYCFYNSGTGTMKREYLKTKCSLCHLQTFYAEMKTVCKRKVLTLKSGRLLDLCQVGYDYPKHVFNYGQRYKIGVDTWRYW